MDLSMIQCKDVSFSYENGISVLKGISFQAKSRESIGIIGANGVGKSTLLRILVGLESGFQGEVLINQIPVTKKTLVDIRRKIGYLFQNSDNQLFTQDVYHDVAYALKNYKVEDSMVEQRVMEALETVGITHLKDKKIYKMSDGEKKLASIATILAMSPDILLLDEPTITLDPKNRRNLIHILNRLDYIKLIASHDLDMILDTCDRVILMSKGQIIKEGATKEILLDQKLLEDNGLELPLCVMRN